MKTKVIFVCKRLAHFGEGAHLLYLIAAAGLFHELHAWLAGAAATTVLASIVIEVMGDA